MKKPSASGVRRSITLPADVNRKVSAIARKRRLSDNRVLLELVEAGLATAAEKEKTWKITMAISIPRAHLSFLLAVTHEKKRHWAKS